MNTFDLDINFDLTLDLHLDLEVALRSNVHISASTTAFEPQFVLGWPM